MADKISSLVGFASSGGNCPFFLVEPTNSYCKLLLEKPFAEGDGSSTAADSIASSYLNKVSLGLPSAIMYQSYI
jgi:hypothetical protein